MIQKGSETARQGIALQGTIRSNADRPIVGLRSLEQSYATKPSASRLEFACLSDGRNLTKNEKDNFYENKVGNGHRGPRYGHRCGDAGPYRLGRVWKARQTEDGGISVARTLRETRR